MMRRSLFVLLIFSACAALLSGCGVKTDISELSANPWVATTISTSGELTKVLEGTSPTVYFRTDGTAVGNASVNAFGADYSLNGRQIEIGSVVTSEWDGPQMELAQEKAMLAALESAQRYAVAQGELVLYGASGDPVMRLDVAPEPKLVGPLWLCTECSGDDGQLVRVEGRNPVGAGFAADGVLSGTGGVGDFTTTYTVDGSAMIVGPEFTATEASGSEEMQAQQSRYYDALKRTASYEIDEYQLTLMDAAGTPLAVHVPLAPTQ